MSNKGLKIFNAFVIIVASCVLFLLPITNAAEDFKRDLRTDSIGSITGAAETSDNITFGTAIYDDDTTSVTVSSDLATDAPVFVGGTYSATNNTGNVSGLTANTTRTLSVTYYIDALTGFPAVADISDKYFLFYLLCVGAFAPAALAAIFINRD